MGLYPRARRRSCRDTNRRGRKDLFAWPKRSGGLSGRAQRQSDLGKTIGIRNRGAEFRASPLIEENLLILFTGGKPGACVIALDKKTGKEVWKALDDTLSNSSPLVIVAGGKRQLIVWTDNAVNSLNPATGKTYWRELMVTISND